MAVHESKKNLTGAAIRRLRNRKTIFSPGVGDAGRVSISSKPNDEGLIFDTHVRIWSILVEDWCVCGIEKYLTTCFVILF